MKVKIQRVHDSAIMPTYATNGSGCFDLYAIAPENKHRTEVVAYGRAGSFRTGLKFEIPEGFVMLVFSRSGHGFVHDIRLSNCVGVIDHDYRGEVMVKLTKDSPGVFPVKTGDRIAQAVIIPYPKVEFEWVESLSETARGTNGFGSTGE